MLPDLQLRQVGTRHVASVLNNGRREDVGEVQEAHLRAYCASLPGSYTAPNSESKLSRNAGLGCARFADAVEQRKKRLMASDPELQEFAAHRLASSQICKENPAMLSAYRADVREI